MVLARFRCALPAAGRPLLAAAFLAAAMLAACGGDGDAVVTTPGAPPPPPATTVSGTAATGAPLSGLAVTLKDSANRSASATTAADGTFSVDTTGMMPPFLLQVVTPGGVRLLSVSSDGEATATVNVTPLTDVVVRSWYNVQGQSADTAFLDPSTLPAPQPEQVRSIAQFLLNVLQLPIRSAGAPISDPADLISRPFAADGTGIDLLLDNTEVIMGSGTVQMILTAGSATQTTDLTYQASSNAMTADTTTVNGSETTTSSASTMVPVVDAQVQALADINAMLAMAASTVNGHGASLAPADLEPFYAADLLEDGLNRTQLLAGLVIELPRIQNLALVVDNVLSLDAAAGTADTIVRYSGSGGGGTVSQRQAFMFRRGTDGAWRFGGNGRIAALSVHAEGRRNQGLSTTGNGTSVNIDVRPVVGTVMTGPGATTFSASFAIPSPQLGQIEVLDSGVQLLPFQANTGPMAPPLPAAGTPVTVTLSPSAGGTVSYVVPLNAFTSELLTISAPSGTSLAAGTHTVTWTLPTTYAVESIQLSALMFTQPPGSSAGFQCINDAVLVAPTATSGQVTVDATCNGQPVSHVNLNLSTNGFNGERSQVVYSLTLAP